MEYNPRPMQVRDLPPDLRVPPHAPLRAVSPSCSTLIPILLLCFRTPQSISPRTGNRALAHPSFIHPPPIHSMPDQQESVSERVLYPAAGVFGSLGDLCMWIE